MALCTSKISHRLHGVSTEPYLSDMWMLNEPSTCPRCLLEKYSCFMRQSYKLHTALSCICHYQRGFLAWWTGADRNNTMWTGLSWKYYGQKRHVERVNFTAERKVQNKSNESRKILRQQMTSSELSNNGKHSNYLQFTNHQGNVKKNLLPITKL